MIRLERQCHTMTVYVLVNGGLNARYSLLELVIFNGQIICCLQEYIAIEKEVSG